MKYGVALIALSTAGLSFARPTGPSETDILNFALGLEHLENAFYSQGLSNFSAQAFEAAGFNSSIRTRYTEIADHEKTHVQFLTTALGSKAVQPCQYAFPVTTVQEFVGLSNIFETVGTSAYTGAAHFLHTPDFLTSAASILATEARQSAFIGSVVLNGIPWSTSFEAPLDLDQALTLASPFIVSCPKSNPPPPATAFLPLTITPSNPTPGQTITLAYPPHNVPVPTFAAFINGLDTTFVPITEVNGKCTVQVPSNLLGVTYILVTTSDKKLQDSNTIAGPTIAIFPFP